MLKRETSLSSPTPKLIRTAESPNTKIAPAATTAAEREAASNDARQAHARAVRSMFDSIAARYDLFNHLFSGNIDARWRTRVARELSEILAKPEAMILDVACGTGDLALALEKQSRASRSSARIIGTDFSRPMLSIAHGKSSVIPFIEGDALHLPFNDASFDAATIGFGLRNLASVAEGLSELRRILKPNGKLVILEFSKPVVPIFAQAFNFYFKKILPRIGDAFNGATGAYVYLSESVRKFPDQTQLAVMMNDAGFTEVSYKNLTGGIAALHIGSKSARDKR